MVDSAYIVKSTPLRAVIESLKYFAYMLSDLLKMCMKKCDAEKNIFLTKMTEF